MVELKGAKVDLDRKMPTRNITPFSRSGTASTPPNRAVGHCLQLRRDRLYSRQKSSNHLHRVFLTELDDPESSPSSYAIFHADSLLGTGMFAQNTGWLLRDGRAAREGERGAVPRIRGARSS